MAYFTVRVPISPAWTSSPCEFNTLTAETALSTIHAMAIVQTHQLTIPSWNRFAHIHRSSMGPLPQSQTCSSNWPAWFCNRKLVNKSNCRRIPSSVLTSLPPVINHLLHSPIRTSIYNLLYPLGCIMITYLTSNKETTQSIHQRDIHKRCQTKHKQLPSYLGKVYFAASVPSGSYA